MRLNASQVVVAFDLDDTLIDSTATIAHAVNEVRALYQLTPLPLLDVAAAIGQGADHLVMRTIGAETGVETATLRAQYDPRYRAVAPLAPLLPGAHLLLQRLHAWGIPMGMLTNKPYAATQLILDRHGWTPWFAIVLGGDSVTFRKPNPEGLNRIAAHPAIRARAERVFVGDSEYDGGAAHAAGWRFAAVNTGRIARFGDVDGWRARAEYVLDQVSDLTHHLDPP